MLLLSTSFHLRRMMVYMKIYLSEILVGVSGVAKVGSVHGKTILKPNAPISCCCFLFSGGCNKVVIMVSRRYKIIFTNNNSLHIILILTSLMHYTDDDKNAARTAYRKIWQCFIIECVLFSLFVVLRQQLSETVRLFVVLYGNHPNNEILVVLYGIYPNTELFIVLVRYPNTEFGRPSNPAISK